MTTPGALMIALQHGDSSFPSGAASFSWGLETLCAEGGVTNAAEVEAFLLRQIEGRWVSFDWPVTVAAFDAAPQPRCLSEIDARVEAQTLAREMRDGSRRSGGALLAVHARLRTPGVEPFKRLVDDGSTCGHLAVVQGLVWRGAGVARDAVSALFAHTFAVAVLGSAIRLGVAGHVDAQRILSVVPATVARLIAAGPVPIDEIHAFTPQAEIAVMRHESADSRLFAN